MEQAMRKFVRNAGVSVMLAALLVAATAMAAAAAPPERETITFSETFQDEFLTDACGVEVTTTVNGRLTFLTFPDRPVGPQDLTSVHVDFLATADDNSVRFKDVGVDLVRVTPDGTVILMIVGQVPFEFTGVLKINLTTGEVILEPQHTVDTTRACRLLTR
jgi:hypothetical protein